MGFFVNETNIIYAIVGVIGILSSLAVVSRGFAANGKYERHISRQKPK